MEYYRHTQTGWLIWAAIAGGIVAVLGTAPHGLEALPAFHLLVVAVLLLAGLCFGSLTVNVSSGQIRVAFGLGLIRRVINSADIMEARKVRNSWLMGWGLRRIPGGWMFNVSGLDAVELRLTGNRVFRIGTDEPERLLDAVHQAFNISVAPAVTTSARKGLRAGNPN